MTIPRPAEVPPLAVLRDAALAALGVSAELAPAGHYEAVRGDLAIAMQVLEPGLWYISVTRDGACMARIDRCADGSEDFQVDGTEWWGPLLAEVPAGN